MKGGWIDYEGPRGVLNGYLVAPEPVYTSNPLPGVVVVQEVWGVDEHIKDVTERIAAAGYVALAPDLYSLGGTRPPELEPHRIEAVKAFMESLPPTSWMDQEQRDKALERLPADQRSLVQTSLSMLFGQARDTESWVTDLTGAVRFLRAHDRVRGAQIGAFGFCMGGGLTALLACTESTLSAAGIFYGASPPLDQAHTLMCPTIGFYGEEDQRITETVPAFAKAVTEQGGHFEGYVYPGAPHGFFNDTRSSYRVNAARHAWAELLRFFGQNLSGNVFPPPGTSRVEALPLH